MSPCSDNRPGDWEHSQHMHEGAGLLCAIARGEIDVNHESVKAWYAKHQEFDANRKRYGSFLP